MSTVKGIWVFKETPDISNRFSYDVNFTSVGVNFAMISIYLDDDGLADALQYRKQVASDAYTTYDAFGDGYDGWVGEAYRIIDFGETEQTVSDEFYTWLTANAVQTPTADLTNTTWNVPSGWTATAGYGKFSVNGEMVDVNGSVPSNNNINCLYVGYFYNSNNDFKNGVTTAMEGYIISDYSMPSVYESSYNLTLSITDGTDVTNPSLIWWLATNGEMEVTEEETPTEYLEITYGDKVFTLTTGQKITFKGGKVMQSDIGVKVCSGEETETELSITITYEGDGMGDPVAHYTYNGENCTKDIVYGETTELTIDVGTDITIYDTNSYYFSDIEATNCEVSGEDTTTLDITNIENGASVSFGISRGLEPF